MAQSIHREVVLPLAWQWVSSVRDELADAMSAQRHDVRDAVVMAGSELAENVVKYGEPLPGQEAGRVAVDLLEGHVRLTTRNGVSDPRRVARVEAQIGDIRAASDLGALYVRRLTQLFESPGEESTGLGLLRVAYEGRFELSSDYVDGVLTIIAERALE